MKKRILTPVLCSALLFSAAFAGGCKKNGENGESGGNEPAAANAVCMVNDFETNADFNLIRLFGVLGRAEKNTDKTYVKTGEASAKVIVDAHPYKSGAPYIEQALKLEKAGEDYTNFSDVAALTLDIFNATGAASRVGLQLTYDYSNGTKKYFDLSEGWNKVTFSVKREYIPESTNAYDVTAPFVQGLRIYFDRPAENAEDSVYYLDNLQLYKTQKSYAPVVMSLKDNEICSFDSDWQVELLEPEGRPEILASYTRVTDITATGSGGALKVEAPASSNDMQSWPGIFLNRKMTKLVDWETLNKPENKNAKLCFDVYAPRENSMPQIWLTMYSQGERYFASDQLAITRGQWTTYSFTMDQLNNGWSGNYNKAKYNVGATDGIVIRWQEHTEGTEIFYLDNFRIEY